jgi:hypothetical protein
MLLKPVKNPRMFIEARRFTKIDGEPVLFYKKQEISTDKLEQIRTLLKEISSDLVLG